MTLEQLYERHAADVRRFATYLSGDPTVADDITSETFLRAWNAVEPIREPTVKAYLFAIARNVYRDELRRRRRHVELDDQVASSSPRQDQQSETASTLEAVLRAARALPDVDRAALLMRAVDGLPYEEIARALGLPLSTAKVKVHRARLKLAALAAAEHIR